MNLLKLLTLSLLIASGNSAMAQENSFTFWGARPNSLAYNVYDRSSSGKWEGNDKVKFETQSSYYDSKSRLHREIVIRITSATYTVELNLDLSTTDQNDIELFQSLEQALQSNIDKPSVLDRLSITCNGYPLNFVSYKDSIVHYYARLNGCQIKNVRKRF